jgi:putative membrane protein
MMSGYGMMAGMGWLGMLLSGLFFIFVVALVMWVLFNLARPERYPSEQDAQQILKRRYARGEISREEFEQAHAALR